MISDRVFVYNTKNLDSKLLFVRILCLRWLDRPNYTTFSKLMADLNRFISEFSHSRKVGLIKKLLNVFIFRFISNFIQLW